MDTHYDRSVFLVLNFDFSNFLSYWNSYFMTEGKYCHQWIIFQIIQGERECSYYVKTGQCKFGATCKFHHPQLTTGIQPQVPSQAHQAPIVPAPTLYQTVQSPSVSSQSYGAVMVARPPLLPSSYFQSPYGPMLIPPGMVPFSGWSPYPVSNICFLDYIVSCMNFS